MLLFKYFRTIDMHYLFIPVITVLATSDSYKPYPRIIRLL